MNLIWLEQLMYQLSGWFMAPVLIAISALFLYCLYELGVFIAQWWQRRRRADNYSSALRDKTLADKNLLGYSLMSHVQQNPLATMDQLDVVALKQLETLRITTRIAPMLGLIATMIPMAPALKSLSDGNIQGISENLIVAFSAVIFGMVIASLSLWLASVKKRWLATELVEIGHIKDHQNDISLVNSITVQEIQREVA